MSTHNRMSQISEENQKRYKDIFETWDDNQDGAMCMKEMENVLQCCGYNPTKEEMEDIMKEFDKDENGTIDFEEFIAFMEKYQGNNGAPEDQMEVMRDTLKELDKDGDGFIDRDELKAIMGPDATDAEADELFDQADTDKNGKIDVEEFARLLTQICY